jgi:tetratricopeptide (TPR) repeat protein
MIGQQSSLEIPIGAGRRDQRWQVAVLCLALAAITFAVFGQTAGFGFVDVDDNVYVYENAKVAGGLSLKSLAWVFTHADCNFYHPLTMLSLMGDYQLHGLHAGGYHFTNVLLHAASAILLFLVLRQMTGALWRSAFVAALFAIHPLRVESVAWVAERKDVLSAFFFMLTLGAYARYVRKPNSLARYLMVATAYVLALLSKPTVVTLPFVLLLLDYWPLRRFEQPQKLSGLILEKVPLLALAAGACVMAVLAEGKWVTPNAHVSMPSRLGNALVYYAVYLRQMVWPEGLAVFYPLPAKGYPVWTIGLSFLLLALIAGGVLAFQRKRRWLLVGWLWYLGMLTPMIGIVQVGILAHEDRFTYLPQIGIYLAVAWLVAEWGSKLHVGRMAIGGLMTTVLGVLIFCAWKQTAYWQDSETLWTHTVACTTGNFVARFALGNALGQKGNLDEAITQFQQALEIKPDYTDAQYNLGIVLLCKGRVDEAITQFQQVLQMTPDFAEACNNLGNALLQKGRVDEAITYLLKALQIKPDYAEAHYNLGNALSQKGRADEAITQYQEALQSKLDYADAHVSLGNLLMQKGRVDEAITQYQKELQSKPDNAKAENNLGNALLQKGSVGGAIAHFQKAVQLEPAQPTVQNNLAWLLATCPEASLRDGAKAVELARQANALTGGENPVILRTLAAALAEAGRFSEAVESTRRALPLAGAQSNTTLAGQLQVEMKLYQAGSPFHSPEQMEIKK